MRFLVLLVTIVSFNLMAVDIGGSFYEGIVNNMNAITATNATVSSIEGDISNIEGDISDAKLDIIALENYKVDYATLDLNVTSTLAAGATVTFPAFTIPANAIIKNSWYEVQTQVVSANDNTIALACGSVTIDTAADLTDVVGGTIAAADITATATSYKNVGAVACVPTITIGAGASGVTAGRVRWFVEYVTR